MTEVLGAAAGRKRYGLNDMFAVRSCSVCGKEFVVSDPSCYAYKRNDGNRLSYFCSWGCLQAFRRKKGLK